MALCRPEPDHRRLAPATVVVEARARSGALITADFALDEGREVLAVPGEITSDYSGGTRIEGTETEEAAARIGRRGGLDS